MPWGAREVPDFPGYFITEDGRLYGPDGKLRHTKIQNRGAGYLTTVITVNGKRHYRLIHRLVLEAFVGRRPQGCVGRHLDGNSMNNHVSNLSWGTQKENVNDRTRHGRTTRNSKYDVEAIRAASGTYEEIARSFGLSKSHVGNIRQGNIARRVGRYA